MVSLEALLLFHWGKRPRYPLNRLGGPQSPSGRYGEVKILDPNSKLRTHGCLARDQLLYRLTMDPAEVSYFYPVAEAQPGFGTMLLTKP
jgi:hypothetical protein